MNLLWNKERKDKLLTGKRLTVSSGCSCLFVKLSRKIGAKIFKSKRARDFAYKNQKLAFELGFGPDIGEQFEIQIRPIAKKFNYEWFFSKRKIGFGYITEAVIIPPGGITLGQFHKLTLMMEKAQFETHDIRYYHNVGLRNNEPVCIDFDRNSIT